MPDSREWERMTRENGVRKDRIRSLLENTLAKAREGAMGDALGSAQEAVTLMREYEEAREKAWRELE